MTGRSGAGFGSAPPTDDRSARSGRALSSTPRPAPLEPISYWPCSPRAGCIWSGDAWCHAAMPTAGRLVDRKLVGCVRLTTTPRGVLGELMVWPQDSHPDGEATALVHAADLEPKLHRLPTRTAES